MATSLGLQTRARNLFGIDATIHNLGGDWRALFAQAGIEPAVLQSRDAVLPFAAFNRLLNLGAEQLQCPQFGVLCALAHQHAPFDVFFQMMKRSPTLKAAHELSDRYRSLESEITFWRVDVQGRLAVVYRYNETPIHFDFCQHRLFTVTRAFRLGRMLLQDDWRPSSVSFGFEKPGPANFEQLLGAPVYFGAEQDSYCFPAADLYKPLPNSDEELLLFLREQAEALQQRFQFGENIVSVVRQLIQQSLPSGNASLPLVAELLAMHPRALQRKLVSEGTTFKRLLLDTRLGMAQMLLAQSPMPLTQIADLLGYSELSAFSRAFKAALGLAPELWRDAAISRKPPEGLEKPVSSG